MSVKERLIKFVEYKKISNSAFCREIGVSAAFISSMRNSIQPSKIERIALKYPELNTGWLLTGEGQMLKNEYSKEERDPLMVEESNVNYQTINRLVAMNEKLFEENRVLKEEIDQLKRALNVQGKSA